MIKENTFITIQSFMVTDLQLKGNELLIYAIIYGFSQDGKSRFTGGLGYLSEWTNSTKQGVLNSLKKLIDKGLIEKEEVFKNNVKYCEYYSTNLNGVLKKVEQGYSTKFNGGIQQSLPNNIYNNINDNINYNTIGSKATKQQTKKTLLEREPQNDIEKVEKAYLLNYRQLFRYGDVKTEKPVINWLQSKKLTKQVIENYGLDNVLLAVNRAMKDDFCIQKGYCLTTILSAGVLSGLINGKPSSSHVNAVQRTGVDEVTDKDLEDINF